MVPGKVSETKLLQKGNDIVVNMILIISMSRNSFHVSKSKNIGMMTINALPKTKKNHLFISFSDTKGYVFVWIGSGVPFDHSLEIFMIIIISMSHIVSCFSQEEYLKVGQNIAASAVKTKKSYKILFRCCVACYLSKCQV